MADGKICSSGLRTFNLFEGFNQRSQDAFDDMRELQAFLRAEGRPERLKEGGLARRIFEEAPAKGFSEAEAAQLMREAIEKDQHAGIAANRDHLEKRLSEELEGVTLNGSREHRVPTCAHVSFDQCEGAGLLIGQR